MVVSHVYLARVARRHAKSIRYENLYSVYCVYCMYVGIDVFVCVYMGCIKLSKQIEVISEK